MAYHRQSFFKEMQKGNSDEMNSSKFAVLISEQNPINETLESSLFQSKETDIPKMSIEERFSFERIEETIDKV